MMKLLISASFKQNCLFGILIRYSAASNKFWSPFDRSYILSHEFIRLFVVYRNIQMTSKQF